jgi:hypothetical protein
MLNKKTVMKITQNAEEAVYSNFQEIGDLIAAHAALGISDMEVFFEKKKVLKLVQKLRKLRFYTRVTEFEALPSQCRVYVSWISDV